MLATTRHVMTLTAALALGLSTVTVTTAPGAVAATPRPPASAPQRATTPNQTPPASQTSTLPNGDSVVITGSGPHASVIVQGPDGHSVPAVRYQQDAHHAYVIPASVLADPAHLDPVQYQVPALTTPGDTPAATPHYPLSPLQINAVGLDGSAATNAWTFLENVDDLTKTNAPIGLPDGVARVEVPAGHYSAVTMFDDYNPTTGINITHLVFQLDVTVTAGKVDTLTADERTATSQLAPSSSPAKRSGPAPTAWCST